MLLVLADKRRLTLLPLVARHILEKRDEIKGLIQVDVTTAVELDKKQVNRLKSIIEEKTGKQVTLNLKVDPDIIGGIIITIDETRIDGSLLKDLDKIKARVRERFIHGT